MINPKHVLTHVIDGHVLKEGDLPFPITRKRTTKEPSNSTGDDVSSIKRLRSRTPEKTTVQTDSLSCEQCGKSAEKKLKYEPYCSKHCSKIAKQLGSPTSNYKLRYQGENGTTKGDQSPDSLPSPTSSSLSINGTSDSNGIAQKKNATVEPASIQTSAASSNNIDVDGDEASSYIVKWSVDEVCKYIRGLVSYCDYDYAEDFAKQDIDGEALVLLNANHLVDVMKIKLGPAVKIMSQIELLRKKSMEQQQ